MTEEPDSGARPHATLGDVLREYLPTLKPEMRATAEYYVSQYIKETPEAK